MVASSVASNGSQATSGRGVKRRRKVLNELQACGGSPHSFITYHLVFFPICLFYLMFPFVRQLALPVSLAVNLGG